VSKAVRGVRCAMMTLLLSAVTGCVDLSSLFKTGLSDCEVGDRAMIRDTLYFGGNRSDGGRVRDAEWRGMGRSSTRDAFV
jgi:hypothetical protein